MDPVLHAEMTQLLSDEKDYTTERATLVKDYPTWKKRVELATNKGMPELADEAAARVEEMRLRISEIDIELEMIEDKKKRLRYEAKRPSGDELRRSNALLNSMKAGGLIDPDEVALNMKFEKLAKKAKAKSDTPDDDDSDIALDFEK